MAGKRKTTRKSVSKPPKVTPRQTQIEVVKTQEQWSQYDLADGTVLKVRPVMIEVNRVTGQYSSTGEPQYALKAAMITDVKSPNKLMKKTR